MAQASCVPNSGNPVIDHQHGRLGALLQIAAQAAHDGADPETFRQTLADFRHFLAHHFSVERVIISGAGFDGAVRHGRIHKALLGRVDAVLAKLDEIVTVSRRHHLLDELEAMLVDHEILEDAAYWDAIRAHGGQSVLRWTDLMVIGIAWIDQQHQHMVECFNRLAMAAHTGDRRDSSRLLGEFLDLAHTHFAAEEQQIAAWGEALPEHRAEHARMLAELDSLVATDDDPCILVDHYLRFWVLDHILGLDRPDLAGRS